MLDTHTKSNRFYRKPWFPTDLTFFFRPSYRKKKKKFLSFPFLFLFSQGNGIYQTGFLYNFFFFFPYIYSIRILGKPIFSCKKKKERKKRKKKNPYRRTLSTVCFFQIHILVRQLFFFFFKKKVTG